MFLNVKSTFIALFLISLSYTLLYGVNAIAVPKVEGLIKRENKRDLCKGFKISLPQSFKNNSEIKCEWSTESSAIYYIWDLELFKADDGKQLAILWNDGFQMKNYHASADITIYSPSDIELPATFFARSWANTTSWSTCFGVRH
ncbi:10102_t:CDS:2, partial [Dentiscutata erythropus]